MLKMVVLCLTSVLIASFWITLCETKDSLIPERILPDKNNSYVFNGDLIKVACRYTATQEIKKIKWSYYVRHPSEDTEQLNNTNTTIRNEWNSNRTVLRSILEVFVVPKKHPKFYYKFQADGTSRLILYNYIQAKHIPKVCISDTIIGNRNATANETIEGVYNSSIEFKCKLDFERNQALEDEYVGLMLYKNKKILAGEPSLIKYGKADGSTLITYKLDGLEVNNGGVYSCVSQMVIGKRHFTSKQYVKLTFPLRLTGESKKEMRVFSSQDVDMVCEIEGFPTPKWIFQYQGILRENALTSCSNILIADSIYRLQVPNGTDTVGYIFDRFPISGVKNVRNITVVQNRLQILDVQPEHEGLYVCIASNEDGYTKTQNFSLQIIANENNEGFKHSQQAILPMYLLLIAVAWFILLT